MVKRKKDSSLDGIIIHYLKKAKCEKSTKSLEKKFEEKYENLREIEDVRVTEKFLNYLRAKEVKKEIESDDLEFEINFGAYQPQPKYKIANVKSRKKNESKKIEKKNEKDYIPKEFIEKIRKLGMKVENAEVLYKSKIDWTAVYSDNKIYCPELTCDYSTKIDNGELTNHLINFHQYGEYNCGEPHCNYVAYSKKVLNRHKSMHKTISNKSFWIKCSIPNCQQTFSNEWKLNNHLRVHNNDLDTCEYCPYRYVRHDHYQTHLKQHFGITDFKCDQCDKEFSTAAKLNAHYGLHEGIIYCCLICNSYEARQKKVMSSHIRRNHPDIFENRRHWEDLQQFIKMKW